MYLPNPVGFSTPDGKSGQTVPVPDLLLSPIVHKTGNVM